jgi:phage shock protein A
MSVKPVEQLSEETTTLFKKLDKYGDDILALKLQITALEGKLSTLIQLMQESIANTPSAAECALRHDRIIERITQVERSYVDKRELQSFKDHVEKIVLNVEEKVNEVKWVLGKIGLALFVPLAAIAVGVIFI